MWRVWAFAVPSAMMSSWATLESDLPWASSSITSRSRGVRRCASATAVQRFLDVEQQKRTYAEALGNVAEEQKHDGVEEHYAQGRAETAGQIATKAE